MNSFLNIFINKFNNSIKINLKYFFTYYSKIIFLILKILKKKGYVEKIFLFKKNFFKILIIEIKYINNISFIQLIKLYSKSSLKIYKGYKKIPKIMNGLGFFIISTTKGLMTDFDCIKKGLGGEIICYVF